MNRLYLVRHGENRANITKEFSHKRVDYPLTPKGRLQAQQTAAYFADKDIHEIYSSPLKRAVETAEIIAARINLDVTVVENFREVNVGLLEGQPPSAEIWAHHDAIIEAWFDGKPEAAFPGGENYFTLWERMQSGIAHIVTGKTSQNIIIVGHGGIFTFTLKDLCRNIDPHWLFKATNANCSITEVLVEQHDESLVGELITWASWAHLHGPAAELIPGTPREQQTE